MQERKSMLDSGARKEEMNGNFVMVKPSQFSGQEQTVIKIDSANAYSTVDNQGNRTSNTSKKKQSTTLIDAS